MDDQRFDNLTRTLANRSTRRSVLKGLAGGVAGVVGLAFGRTVAWAAPNRCAVFCSQYFAKGPAGASCRQACRECDADLSRMCVGPTGAACCAPGAECCIDRTGMEHCIEPCPEGMFLDFATCQCRPFVECVDDCVNNVCGVDPLAICGENPQTGSCLCAQSVSETCSCVQPFCGDFCDPAAPACPDGFVCINEQCCGYPSCVPLCEATAGAGATSADRWG